MDQADAPSADASGLPVEAWSRREFDYELARQSFFSDCIAICGSERHEMAQPLAGMKFGRVDEERKWTVDRLQTIAKIAVDCKIIAVNSKHRG